MPRCDPAGELMGGIPSNSGGTGTPMDCSVNMAAAACCGSNGMLDWSGNGGGGGGGGGPIARLPPILPPPAPRRCFICRSPRPVGLIEPGGGACIPEKVRLRDTVPPARPSRPGSPAYGALDGPLAIEGITCGVGPVGITGCALDATVLITSSTKLTVSGRTVSNGIQKNCSSRTIFEKVLEVLDNGLPHVRFWRVRTKKREDIIGEDIGISIRTKSSSIKPLGTCQRSPIHIF
jgi:hypothetical protein